jgi:thioredoxin 1
MSSRARLWAVVLVVVAVIAVIGVKEASRHQHAEAQSTVTAGQLRPPPPPSSKPINQAAARPADAKATNPARAQKPKLLPKLVDLGAKSCLPCKMMVPVLEELTKEYQGRLEVVFHDVWENPQAGRDYGIRVIPTQVFLDTQGKEFFRHEGYMPKADILAKFKGHGINLGGGK